MNDLESYEIQASRRESVALAREQYSESELRIRDSLNESEALSHSVYSRLSAIVADHFSTDRPASAAETSAALVNYLGDIKRLENRIHGLQGLFAAKAYNEDSSS